MWTVCRMRAEGQGPACGPRQSPGCASERGVLSWAPPWGPRFLAHRPVSGKMDTGLEPLRHYSEPFTGLSSCCRELVLRAGVGRALAAAWLPEVPEPQAGWGPTEAASCQGSPGYPRGAGPDLCQNPMVCQPGLRSGGPHVFDKGHRLRPRPSRGGGWPCPWGGAGGL